MKLTIVIPAYKVEKYIAKCIQSCLNQDVPEKEYEIVVVNDGTPDKSAIIAKEFAAKHANIKVIDQDNQGLSVARNTGIHYSKGDYIWFVDSDDYIADNCLARLFHSLTNDIDILQLQYKEVYEDNTPDSEIKQCLIDGVRSGREVTLNGGLPAPAQFAIYRRGFLLDNKLEFVPNIYHEDTEFKPRAVYLAKKISSDNGLSYCYLQRTQGSIKSTFSIKRITDSIFVNNSLLEFSRKLPSDIRRSFNDYIGLNVNSILYDIRSLSSDDQKRAFELLEDNMHFFKCMRHSNNYKYIIEGIVFGLSFKCGVFFYKMVR